VRTSIRRLYLFAAFVVSIAACVHIAVDPISSWNDTDSLRAYEFILGLLIVTWLIKDPKLSNHERPSFDHALMHLVFFPLFAAYQQFSIRRWRGIAIVFALFLLLIAPFLTMLVIG